MGSFFERMPRLPAGGATPAPNLDDPAAAPIQAIFWEDYGNPQDPVMSKILYAYSPYHNIRDGVAYPAVFQVFGEKDAGCRPFHGRKFTEIWY